MSFIAKAYFSLSFFFISINSIFPQNYWLNQSSPTQLNLRDCIFVNNNTGWISGDSGLIMRTTNNGNNWIIQKTNVKSEIKSIFFLNHRLGWALAWNKKIDSVNFIGTIILKTTNGGDVWTKEFYSDTNYLFSAVYFLDSLKGFIGGQPQFILYTTNGGQSWINAISDSISFNGFPVSEIYFVNNQLGYACGGYRDLAGIIWRTTNAGINWKPKVVGPDPINSLCSINNDTAIGVSTDFKFGSTYVKTINQGLTWQIFDLGYIAITTGIDFRTPLEGWISLDFIQKFFYTTNGGNNWNFLETPINPSLFDVTFIDSLNGWAVGDSGTILKYNSTMVYYANSEENIISKNFSLYQNYPNPFNPVTIINYDVIENKGLQPLVQLKVYDALGKEISTLVQERQGTGKYSINFEGGSLASGIYFYELKVENSSQVKKMLLLR